MHCIIVLSLMIVTVCGISTEQMDYLLEWGVCSPGTVATADCFWARGCYGNACDNGMLTYMTIADYKFRVINESSRAGFGAFPEVEGLTIEWFSNANTIELYPELGLFTNLERLNNNAVVTGTIPSELDQLTHLYYLDLGNSRLTGTIPTSLSSLPLTTFEINGVSSNLHGPVPNFPNITLCTLSSRFLGTTESNNPNLFCPCFAGCAPHGGGTNICSQACGTLTTATCNAAVPTLSNGYVCTDACNRCGMDQCMLRIDNAAYYCPGDPTNPPVEESSEPRTTPTIDGNPDDNPSSSGASRWSIM